jgi:hypothetical protein
VGNCTAAHREQGLFIPGCPPVGSAILKAIQSGKGAAPKEGNDA